MTPRNELFLDYLETIHKQTGLSESEISKAVGRNSAYIAQQKSRINKAGAEVSDKLLGSLQLRFKGELSNRSKLPEMHGDIIEKVITLQARVNVLIVTVAGISAQQKGTDVELVSGQIHSAIEYEIGRLQCEFSLGLF